MSITRIEVEQIMNRRLGAYLADAGMDNSEGVNHWLTDPLRWALRMLGYATGSFVSVVDADLSGVPNSSVDALLDLTEMRALEGVLGNLTDVTVTAGPLSVKSSELPDRLQKIIAAKRNAINAMHRDLLTAPLDGEGPTIARLRAL